MSPTPDLFIADAALRLEAPPAPRRRGRLATAVLVAIGVELAVFLAVWFEREYKPPVEPIETPVEIVVEPPPPPPPPPPPEPEAKPQPPPDLTPGIDAPREGKSDHEDAEVGEKEKPAAPPPPPEPSPSPEATTPAAEAPAPELPKAEEAETPEPLKTEAPAPAAPAKPTVAEVLAKAFADAPEIDLGGVAMKAPVSGGRAKATYLSILYGLTKAQERIPPVARTYGRKLTGVINVSIDGNGRMLTRYISQSSGSPELDEAEMQAIANASRKFPPPPGRVPIDLSYTFGLK
jgi:protein TonB